MQNKMLFIYTRLTATHGVIFEVILGSVFWVPRYINHGLKITVIKITIITIFWVISVGILFAAYAGFFVFFFYSWEKPWETQWRYHRKNSWRISQKCLKHNLNEFIRHSMFKDSKKPISEKIKKSLNGLGEVPEQILTKDLVRFLKSFLKKSVERDFEKIIVILE